MPYKPRRRKRSNKNFVALPFNTQIALATLADETVLTSALLSAFGEDFFCISADISLALDNVALSEVPVEVGLAHGDYTAAEIKEYVNANLTDPDDKIAQEHSRRQIRRIGLFGVNAENQVLNHGDQQRIKLRFSIGDTKELKLWIMNHTGAAMTTGAIVTAVGTLYGRWQR